MSDLIERQVAIDAVVRVREHHAYDEIEELNALPSAQPEPHWIPVTERLPECSGWHIVTLQRNDCALVSYRWYSTVHGWEYGEIPTAWLPLPEPYKGDA